MIRNVIFDLDGTLLDTREGVIESAKYAAKEMGYSSLPHETMLTFVGPPIQNSFMKHYGCDEETAQKAANIFRDYYKNKALLLAEPYEGIYDLCKILKENGVKMSVATYKREDYAQTLLRHFGFDKFCNPMHGADNTNILKKEDIVRMCQDEMGASGDSCVLIGDTDNDAKGAIKAHTKFIAVTYGFGFKNEKDVIDYPHIGIAHKPIEIKDIILGK